MEVLLMFNPLYDIISTLDFWQLNTIQIIILSLRMVIMYVSYHVFQECQYWVFGHEYIVVDDSYFVYENNDIVCGNDYIVFDNIYLVFENSYLVCNLGYSVLSLISPNSSYDCLLHRPYKFVLLTIVFCTQ